MILIEAAMALPILLFTILGGLALEQQSQFYANVRYVCGASATAGARALAKGQDASGTAFSTFTSNKVLLGNATATLAVSVADPTVTVTVNASVPAIVPLFSSQIAASPTCVD
jgi:hypothetical protein